MTPSKLVFRCLTFSEFEILVQWAANEGWNPGLDDAIIFWQTDPNGFYGYFDDHRLVGGGSIVSYNGRFGFMGFFIVHPDYRSRGIGNALWLERRNTLLSRLEPGAAIGMDGVVAMQPFYQKGGFEIAYRDERYVRLGASFTKNAAISLCADGDFEAIQRLDTDCFGFDRTHFLKPWLFASHAKAFQYKEQGHLKGFAVLRQCQNGYKIGPLFADTAAVAEALYEECLSNAIDQNIYLDIPTSNLEAVAIVKKYEASYVFECARMYYGAPPKVALEKVFGITSFELG